MILKLFRANSLLNFILLPLIGFALIVKTLLDGGTFPVADCLNTTPICSIIYNSGLSHTAAILLNYLLLIIMVILFMHMNGKFALVQESTFLPPLLYILIVYSLPDLHIIQPVYFAAIFILLAIRSIFISFSKRKALSSSFDAGLLISLASVFYLYSLALLILVPISIFTIRSNLSWKEVTLAIIGAIIPWLFVFMIYFIGHDLASLQQLLVNAQTTKTSDLIFQWPVQVFFGFLMLLTIISSVFIIKQYGNKKISTRRYYKVFAFIFGFTFILFLVPPVSIEIIVIMAIPLSFLFTNYLVSIRRRFWAELFTYLLVLFAVVLQFMT